jgi:hypothetical protein
MGDITLSLSERAESYLRGKNAHKGDMGKLVSTLLEQQANVEGYP